jgi:hypothetical protein
MSTKQRTFNITAHEDEPLVVLRASDPFASSVLRILADNVSKYVKNAKYAQELHGEADKFDAYHTKVGVEGLTKLEEVKAPTPSPVPTPAPTPVNKPVTPPPSHTPPTPVNPRVGGTTPPVK